jgi:uncharacterized membrane protein
MVEQKTIDYIKESLVIGKSKEDIYKDLLAQGQTINSIGESFSLSVQESQKENSKKRITNIMAVIGAILIGAGIFSFVAANWQEVGKFYKILIILCSMLSSYYGGWILKEKYHRVKTGEALILLGSIIYGAGIFLIGQMFNIRANWPDAFILWMFGLLALGLALNSFVIFYFAVPVGFVAIVGHPFDIFNNFTEDRFLLTSSVMLLTATVVTFIFGIIL